MSGLANISMFELLCNFGGGSAMAVFNIPTDVVQVQKAADVYLKAMQLLAIKKSLCN